MVPVDTGSWTRCFKEIKDPLDWGGASKYDDQNIWWSKLTWDPITQEHGFPDCYLEVTVSTQDGNWLDYPIRSAGFGFGDEIIHQALATELSIVNEQVRRMTPDPGWDDAGGGFGENRSHGTFLSGLAWLLGHRRSELTTQEVNDLVSAVSYGIYYLEQLAQPEYDYVGVDSQGNPAPRLDDHEFPDPTHWVNVANQVARDGHIFHEHHARSKAGGPGDEWWDDSDNDDSRIFRAASGLIDAARYLQPFDPAIANDAYVQADKTKIYLYDSNTLFQVAKRFRASWWFTFHEYRQLAAGTSYNTYYDGYSDLNSGQIALEADLFRSDPTTGLDPDLRQWVIDDGTLNASTRFPVEGLLYAIAGGLTPQWGYKNGSFLAARDAIIDDWYESYHGPEDDNPIRITRFWKQTNKVKNFKGNVKWVTDLVLMEVLALASLADSLDPLDPTYADKALLVELATGTMNYLLGMHPGIRGRYASPPSDQEFAGAGFVNAMTSLTAGQLWMDHGSGGQTWWTTVSVQNMIHGDEWPATDWPAPTHPPWTFTPQQQPDGETFILADGIALIATEVLGTVLHPRTAIEVEGYTTGSRVFDSVGNNDSGAPLYNGGLSLISLGGGDWFTQDFSVPTNDGQTHSYRVLLRVANPTAQSQSVRVTFDPGPSEWVSTVAVPPGPTAQVHNYFIVDATTQGSPVLGNLPHTLRLDFLWDPDALSLDCVVIKHRSAQ